MDVTAVLNALFHGNQLKRTARTGWVQRGVPEAENVAAHSYGVTFTALILAHYINEPVEMSKLLVMAVLHDLPEGLTTDIPVPAWRYLPPGAKREMERGAMRQILGDLPFAPDLAAVWEELNASQSLEARLVHDADKIDLFIQATIYEEQTGNRHLLEFWTLPAKFYTTQAQAIYDALWQRRGQGSGGDMETGRHGDVKP